jgi:hypothetical protein
MKWRKECKRLIINGDFPHNKIINSTNVTESEILGNMYKELDVCGKIKLAKYNPHLRLRGNRNVKLEEGLDWREMIDATSINSGVVVVMTAVVIVYAKYL